MYVHWKSVIFFNFLFWMLLYVTDLFGDSSWKKYSKHVLPDILENQLVLDKIMKMKIEQKSSEQKKYIYNGFIIIWSIIAFIFPLIFFIFTKTIYAIALNFYKNCKNLAVIKKLLKGNNDVTRKSLSKIPLLLQNKSDNSTPLKLSSTNVQFVTLKAEQSCPDLFKKSEETFCDANDKENLQDQILQLTSDNTTLSRQLDTIKKEKHELSKQLALAYNENQNAKKQIDELLTDNSNISKKLDVTNKELKISLKNKKLSLIKLEEITANEGKIKLQLEHVTHDRDCLRKKLKSFESELEKLKHRLKCYENIENCRKLAPEKDTTDNQSSVNENETDVEIDMKEIQLKINQLQECYNFGSGKIGSFESNSKVSLLDLNESNMDVSERKLLNSSYNYNTNLINTLLNDKLCPNKKSLLLTGKYTSEDNSSENFYHTDNTESESDERCLSHRLISNSVGFQNLLKNLNSSNQKSKKI